jgi:hypothetical protein
MRPFRFRAPKKPPSSTTRPSTSASSVLRASKVSSSVPAPGCLRTAGALFVCQPTVAPLREQSEPGMRRCAGMRGDYRIGKIRLDFWARRSYLKCMTLILAVLMQRRIAPAETFERGSAGASIDPSAAASAGPSRSTWPRSPRAQTQRRPRASRFADISAAHRCRYMNPETATPISSPTRARRLPRALTLDALAIAAALATHRFSAEPRRRRSAAALRGAVGGPQAAVWASREGHPSGRPSGHPSGRPSGRFADSTEGGFLARQRCLLALRFADIPASRKGRCASPVCRIHSRGPVWLDAPFAPDACAIAPALATQRFSGPPRWRCAGPGGIA